MMKRKALISLALAALLLLSCMAGCAGSVDPTDTAKPSTPKVNPAAPAVPLSAITNAKNLGFTEFDNQLVEYLKQAGRENENFTVSPLSFKAALAMAALGADGETQTQLLTAMGFRNADELRAWYATVLAGVTDFDNYIDALMADAYFYSMDDDANDSGSQPARTAAYRVVNSIWSNLDLPGEFRQSFVDDVANTCQAEAKSAEAKELARVVNAWVNEQTNGLIPSILDDLTAAESSAILVNALYLKSGWENSFHKLGDKDFTTRSGEKVQKPFMVQEAHLNYYKDGQTQLVSVPLQGGVSMVFVLGDDSGLADKLSKAENKLVEVTVPMFDVETSLDQSELVNYLKLMGCDRMFSDQNAEFGPMYTEPLYVGDIIQKAKVHIDEEGLEAAAVTAILMVAGCAEPEPETPEIFCADRPFSFYVVKNGEAPELLFWGQIVK